MKAEPFTVDDVVAGRQVRAYGPTVTSFVLTFPVPVDRDQALAAAHQVCRFNDQATNTAEDMGTPYLEILVVGDESSQRPGATTGPAWFVELRRDYND